MLHPATTCNGELNSLGDETRRCDLRPAVQRANDYTTPLQGKLKANEFIFNIRYEL